MHDRDFVRGIIDASRDALENPQMLF